MNTIVLMTLVIVLGVIEPVLYYVWRSVYLKPKAKGWKIVIPFCFYFSERDSCDINHTISRTKIYSITKNCKNCRFNAGTSCNVGTYFAKIGMCRVCYDCNLWESE